MIPTTREISLTSKLRSLATLAYLISSPWTTILAAIITIIVTLSLLTPTQWERVQDGPSDYRAIQHLSMATTSHYLSPFLCRRVRCLLASLASLSLGLTLAGILQMCEGRNQSQRVVSRRT